MIPRNYDYYRRRANEHRVLAQRARAPEQRGMHDRLRDAYMGLARQSRRREVLTLKL